MPDPDASLLMPRGTPDAAFAVALYSRAYATLVQITSASLPSELVGALIGDVQSSGGRQIVAIREAMPCKLVPYGANMTLDHDQWLSIKLGLTSEGGGLRIVGWFYSDPGIGLFAPRMDVLGTQEQVASDASLLLLINPLTEQGAFYLWSIERHKWRKLGGFYEVLPSRITSPFVSWSGEVDGAADWPPFSVDRVVTAPLGEPVQLPANVPADASRNVERKTEPAASPAIERETILLSGSEPEQGIPTLSTAKEKGRRRKGEIRQGSQNGSNQHAAARVSRSPLRIFEGRRLVVVAAALLCVVIALALVAVVLRYIFAQQG